MKNRVCICSQLITDFFPRKLRRNSAVGTYHIWCIRRHAPGYSGRHRIKRSIHGLTAATASAVFPETFTAFAVEKKWFHVSATGALDYFFASISHMPSNIIK